MIIDNLKEFMAKLSDTSQKNNDCYEEDVLGGDPVCEKEFEFETDEDKDDSPEILGGIQDPDIYIGDMYGPAPEYDDEDLDTCVPDENDIIEKKDAQE